MKREVDISVVKAAEKRIVTWFKRNKHMVLSFSGGKDSICTADVIVKAMQKNAISFDRLTVVFFDEEGIFPDFEQTVKEWRLKFLDLGSRFYWFCLPIKHYNCVNKLQNDETFICWEPGKEHLWMRPKPSFAISRHKKFRRGMDYQTFNDRLCDGIPNIVGLRIFESMQRQAVVRRMGPDQKKFLYPIYDWRDNDVWLYIQRNNLKFPDTYIQLYKVGVTTNRLRISQFFSVDTIRVIPKILEFQPELYQRIIKREPNADLVMLYWETDMFRSSQENRKFSGGEKKDWKTLFYKELKKAKNNPEMYPTARNGIPAQKQLNVLLKDVTDQNTQAVFQGMYQVLIAGDPKNRTVRAIQERIKRENRSL